MLSRSFLFSNIHIYEFTFPPPDEMDCIYYFQSIIIVKNNDTVHLIGGRGLESFLINLTICRYCQNLCHLHVVDSGNVTIPLVMAKSRVKNVSYLVLYPSFL